MRQEQIEVHNETWQPFCIFPEGTTSNGEQLFPFKRGAFEAMRSI
jgi:1-acyl-sn-glycerol-3-phosphate acyltransferase